MFVFECSLGCSALIWQFISVPIRKRITLTDRCVFLLRLWIKHTISMVTTISWRLHLCGGLGSGSTLRSTPGANTSESLSVTASKTRLVTSSALKLPEAAFADVESTVFSASIAAFLRSFKLLWFWGIPICFKFPCNPLTLFLLLKIQGSLYW